MSLGRAVFPGTGDALGFLERTRINNQAMSIMNPIIIRNMTKVINIRLELSILDEKEKKSDLITFPKRAVLSETLNVIGTSSWLSFNLKKLAVPFSKWDCIYDWLYSLAYCNSSMRSNVTPSIYSIRFNITWRKCNTITCTEPGFASFFFFWAALIWAVLPYTRLRRRSAQHLKYRIQKKSNALSIPSAENTWTKAYIAEPLNNTHTRTTHTRTWNFLCKLSTLILFGIGHRTQRSVLTK